MAERSLSKLWSSDIDLFTVSNAILLGEGEKFGRNYNKCMGKVQSSMPNNMRVIDVLKILQVTAKTYPAEGCFD